ncbi:MAG: hypothetical protein IPM82_18060 [Saprospiraceae bacterium]|nr:hypothetical protein [Saprospiraceae bacterium]
MWLAMADNDPNTCYLAGSTPNETAIVLKTSNGGDSWQHVFLTENNQNIFTGYSGDGGDLGWTWGGNALGFTVNRLNSQQALMTDYGFAHETTDGGLTWHQGYTDPSYDPLARAEKAAKKYQGIGLEQTTCWQVYWFDEQNMFACFTDIRAFARRMAAAPGALTTRGTTRTQCTTLRSTTRSRCGSPPRRASTIFTRRPTSPTPGCNHRSRLAKCCTPVTRAKLGRRCTTSATP